MKTTVYILLAVAFFILAVILYALREWLKSNIEEIIKNNADDEMKIKTIKLLFPTLFVAFVATLVLSIVTLLMPLLTVLFGALAASLLALLDKVGGFLIIIGCIVVWLRNRKAEQRQANMQAQQEQQEQAQRAYDEQRAVIYETQAKVLYAALRDSHNMGLNTPSHISGIYSPSRTFLLNGNTTLCTFLIEKEHEDLDGVKVKQQIQTKIQQILSAGDFPGIYPTYTYNGRQYSGIIVYRVDVSNAGFAEVETAYASDDFCRYLQNLELNKKATLPVNRRDITY